MKSFEIPTIFKSEIIAKIKNFRREGDKLKRNFEPTILDFGPVKFLIARHFGFCYGVENAIEIAYKAIAENVNQRIFLLSEMIHNPEVNSDLLNRGVKFIMDTAGNQLINWNDIDEKDIVIVPAFGTTVEIQNQLKSRGIDPYLYDTTCPFVEKVWKKANQIGSQDYTIIVHGKPKHEETRATFSHSQVGAPTMVIKDMDEAILLGKFINNEIDTAQFERHFTNRFSQNFDPKIHLQKLGVVNQTTMLASETQAISDYLKNILIEKYNLQKDNVLNHFADTRDTLCYATNDNQSATMALLKYEADFAIVAGGYNSSNTSHIVELCESVFPTYFIESQEKVLNQNEILNFDLHEKKEKLTLDYLPQKETTTIILTCGASCPDSVVEGILRRFHGFFPDSISIDLVMANLLTK